MSNSSEAFKRIRERLTNDVGGIIELIYKKREEKDWCPWWALVRMLLPIAEAIGDLIHGEKETTNNLLRVLKEDLNTRNEKYSKVAAIIVLIYRHSLVHQDELRKITSGIVEVGWVLSFGEEHKSKHLDILKKEVLNIPSLWIRFDVTQFYEDLVQLCLDKEKNPNNEAAERYSKWLKLDISHGSKRIEKEAKNEIKNILNLLP